MEGNNKLGTKNLPHSSLKIEKYIAEILINIVLHDECKTWGCGLHRSDTKKENSILLVKSTVLCAIVEYQLLA